MKSFSKRIKNFFENNGFIFLSAVCYTDGSAGSFYKYSVQEYKNK